MTEQGEFGQTFKALLPLSASPSEMLTPPSPTPSCMIFFSPMKPEIYVHKIPSTWKSYFTWINVFSGPFPVNHPLYLGLCLGGHALHWPTPQGAFKWVRNRIVFEKTTNVMPFSNLASYLTPQRKMSFVEKSGWFLANSASSIAVMISLFFWLFLYQVSSQSPHNQPSLPFPSLIIIISITF